MLCKFSSKQVPIDTPKLIQSVIIFLSVIVMKMDCYKFVAVFLKVIKIFVKDIVMSAIIAKLHIWVFYLFEHLYKEFLVVYIFNRKRYIALLANVQHSKQTLFSHLRILAKQMHYNTAESIFFGIFDIFDEVFFKFFALFPLFPKIMQIALNINYVMLKFYLHKIL